MPVLKNARHEAYAQARAKGKTVDEAYIEAGFKANRGNAARLNANESIRKRVEEITSRVAEKAEWSAADRLIALKSIFDTAQNTDPRVAISAIAEANKMQGSYAPSKVEHSGNPDNPIEHNHTVKARDLSDDELARIAAGRGK